MGFETEFNWALKLKQEQGLDEENLEVNKIYNFSKKGYREYPINIPIDLINNEWVAVAKVLIIESKKANDKTEGKYKVIKIYQGNEKDFLTGYWRENVEIIKNKKIDNFSNVKVT